MCLMNDHVHVYDSSEAAELIKSIITGWTRARKQIFEWGLYDVLCLISTWSNENDIIQPVIPDKEAERKQPKMFHGLASIEFILVCNFTFVKI